MEKVTHLVKLGAQKAKLDDVVALGAVLHKRNEIMSTRANIVRGATGMRVETEANAKVKVLSEERWRIGGGGRMCKPEPTRE